jgi:hypothetical protein
VSSNTLRAGFDRESSERSRAHELMEVGEELMGATKRESLLLPAKDFLLTRTPRLVSSAGSAPCGFLVSWVYTRKEGFRG